MSVTQKDFHLRIPPQRKICSLWHCLWLDQIADKFVRFWHSGKQEKYLQDIKTGSQNVKDCYRLGQGITDKN